MVAIAPFRALRFGRHLDLAAVTCPPHDVMTEAERDAFMAREDHNIAHVVLGRGEDRHQRATESLRRWEDEGHLVRDGAPALYAYEVHHGPPGARKVMRGFFARIALDPAYQEVRPHEKTLKHVTDRRRLREITGCDTEPIWMLYRDERGWIDEVLFSNAMEEVARLTDEDGTEHRLWRVDRPQAVGEVVAQFEERTVVIADGHHRYRTALEHAAATGRPEHDSILACFVRDTDPGIGIQATFRLVTGLEPRTPQGWAARPLATRDPPSLLRSIKDARDVVVVTKGDVTHLRDERPAASPDLAVARLHEGLLVPWGLDPERPETHLRFTRSADDAVARVGKDCDVAVLLHAERVESVLEMAKAGRLMPQKATYFVPKLRSGLVMSPLDEPRPTAPNVDPGPADFRRLPL